MTQGPPPQYGWNPHLRKFGEAGAADVRSGAQADVCAGEPGELGHAQPGADRGEQEGVVAAPGPGLPVGDGEQGVAFGVGEPADDRRVRPAGLDGQDALDDGGVVRCPQGRVAEQGADRGQAGVSGARAAVAAGFQPAQERGDQGGVELPDVQFPRRGAGGVLREGQQQPPGVPVGADRVLAGVLLGDHAVGEEALQDGSEIAHGGSSWS